MSGILETLKFLGSSWLEVAVAVDKQLETQAARIAELENLVAYLCGQNTDHIRVALAGNPTVVDAVVARAEAALEGGKKDE
jgi:hypothetical protein